MTTHTITVHIPSWVDHEGIEWGATIGGAPRGVFERDLQAHGTIFELGGDRKETTGPFFLSGDTDHDEAQVALSVGSEPVSFGTPARARAFAAALLDALDEAEKLIEGAK